MQTRFLSRIVNREMYRLLTSAASYPVHRGYTFPQGATLPATLFFMESGHWEGAVTAMASEHLTSGTYRFVVRTDAASSSDVAIAEEAERLLDAVAGQQVYTDDGYQVTFTALGETPVTSIYDGAQEYQRLGVTYQVDVTEG